jgi:hypothetical protein
MPRATTSHHPRSVASPAVEIRRAAPGETYYLYNDDELPAAKRGKHAAFNDDVVILNAHLAGCVAGSVRVRVVEAEERFDFEEGESELELVAPVAEDGYVLILHSIYVAPWARGRGVMRALADHLASFGLPIFATFIDHSLGVWFEATHPAPDPDDEEAMEALYQTPYWQLMQAWSLCEMSEADERRARIELEVDVDVDGYAEEICEAVDDGKALEILDEPTSEIDAFRNAVRLYAASRVRPDWLGLYSIEVDRVETEIGERVGESLRVIVRA